MRAIRWPAAVLLVAGFAASFAAQAWGQRAGFYTLDPKTYRSPSGEYALYVDPNTMYGQGPGRYRMSRGGQEMWSKELPFTLWDAGVADDGTIAGYAYSGGKENWVPRGAYGRLHLVIIDPNGGVRLDDAFPREGAFTCISTVDRSAEGVILDPENDRVIMRVSEGHGFSRSSEIWRAYRLSTGAPIDQFLFDHPRATDQSHWFLQSARAIAGTPLILVHWQYTTYDAASGSLRSWGSRFHLIDPEGSSVWELDRPQDYPEYDDYKDKPDERAQSALDFYLRDHGAILRTDQPRRFDVWFVLDNQRVTFAVQRADAGGWRVTEDGRVPYKMPDPADAHRDVGTLELRHLGTIKLQTGTTTQPEIRDIVCFDIDDQGRIGFLRSEQEGLKAFLLVDSAGNVLRRTGLSSELGAHGAAPKLTWVDGPRWLLAVTSYDAAPGGGAQTTTTRVWWLNVDTGAVTPIEGFTGQHASYFAATHDGGFVVAISPDYGTSQCHELVAFDRDAKERWRAVPRDEIHGLTVTTRGRIITLHEYGERVFYVTTLDGKVVETHPAHAVFGDDKVDVDFITADSDDGILACLDPLLRPHMRRVRSDWTVGEKLEPHCWDGRLVRAGFPMTDVAVRVGARGAIWACDGHAFLRLDADGEVDRVFGEGPDTLQLRIPSGAAVDPQGRIYVAEDRNGDTHVFDSTGRRVRILRPDPKDFDNPYRFNVQVAHDGAVYVDDVQFSPTGERVGHRPRPPGIEDEELLEGGVFQKPRTPGYWFVARQSVSLVGDDNAVTRTEWRRPDRTWLNHISGAAVALDGSLAVAADGGGSLGEDRDRNTINVYAASGEPIRTIEIPKFLGVDSLFSDWAFSGRYVITTAWGSEEGRSFLFLDTRADQPLWFRLGGSVADVEWWRWFVAGDGRELWLLGEDSLQVERFALPTDSELAAAASPTTREANDDAHENARAAPSPAPNHESPPSQPVSAVPPAAINQLKGVVVRKSDGQPLADFAVVMAHGGRGSVGVSHGEPGAGSPSERPSRDFVRRDARFACDAVTDEHGFFALRGFATPSEAWNITAGDAERGLWLRTDIVPNHFVDQPLRIEIEAPAYITVNSPAGSADVSTCTTIGIEVADARGSGAAALALGDVDDWPEMHVSVADWPDDPNASVWRLGPFPPNHIYRVTRGLKRRESCISAPLFQRDVFLRPGVTELVALELEGGVTLQGRLTDTEGKPLADVEVRLSVGGDAGIVLGAVSDADGRYALPTVPFGTHTLAVLRQVNVESPCCVRIPRIVLWQQNVAIAVEPQSQTLDIGKLDVTREYRAGDDPVRLRGSADEAAP